MLSKAADEDLWNVLAEAWLEVSSHDGVWRRISPLDALASAGHVRAVAASSPLDEFATLRFLTTLLHWKAPLVGGVAPLRRELQGGAVPAAVLEALRDERHHFNLFDSERPFLQDPRAGDRADKPVGSLYAEIATGTNIAHFDHSRDLRSPLCVPCVLRGLLRLVPWSQSGGAGLTPSIHGAPPIAFIPHGASLAATLGWMLSESPVPLGAPTWTGAFQPSNPNGPIPLLEAMTWNPRRVLLPRPRNEGPCGLCGTIEPCITSIVFKKNDAVKKPEQAEGKAKTFAWTDPAFVYDARTAQPKRSGDESRAALGTDLAMPSSAPMLPHSDGGVPRRWSVVVPCTNPANNKTFDHRRVEVESLADLDSAKRENHGAAPVILAELAFSSSDIGWPSGLGSPVLRNAITRFVGAAVVGLREDEWVSLKEAVGRPMHRAPAAFAAFSAILWRVRSGGRSVFRRDAAWSLLKLMSHAPSSVRGAPCTVSLEPLLASLPRRQGQCTTSQSEHVSPYPVSPPSGLDLELALVTAVDAEIARGRPVPWIDLGAFLHASSR